MDDIVLQFLSLPSFLIYAATGAIGGVVGSMIGLLLKRRLNSSKTVGVSVLLCALVAIQLTTHFLPRIQESMATEGVMASLENNRLFQVIFRLHPEAEVSLRNEMAQIIADKTDEDGTQAFFRAQTASARIIAEYFPRYLGSGSDDATYRLLTHQIEVMKRLRDRPELCVSYYLGSPEFERDELTPESVAEESNLKADLIESAVAGQPLLPAQSHQAIVEALIGAYEDGGYPTEDMDKVSIVDRLPPKEGCEVALEFTEALVSLGPEKSARIFRGLVHLGQDIQ